MDKLGPELQRLIARTGALIVWRSSFVLQEHVFRSNIAAMKGNLPAKPHFMTDMRRMEFESYAQYVLVGTGVYIWDVHAMSALGMNKLQDMVHASHSTEWVMNSDLIDTFICPA